MFDVCLCEFFVGVVGVDVDWVCYEVMCECDDWVGYGG